MTSRKGVEGFFLIGLLALLAGEALASPVRSLPQRSGNQGTDEAVLTEWLAQPAPALKAPGKKQERRPAPEERDELEGKAPVDLGRWA